MSHRFQSALPRGERQQTRRHSTAPMHFNPRSRVGSDRISELKSLIETISTRAPARGATEELMDNFLTLYISTRPPTRGATCKPSSLSNATGFQPALPRGERLLPFTHRPTVHYFNPRSHVGSDQHVPLIPLKANISIRAPT